MTALQKHCKIGGEPANLPKSRQSRNNPVPLRRDLAKASQGMREKSGPQGTDGNERQEIYDRGKNPDLETGRGRRNDFGGVPGGEHLEVTFHRWKKQFGQMEVSEAKRLKELERENTELKKMLAESLLKNRVLEAVCEKKL